VYREEFGKLFWLGLPLALAQVAQNTTSLVDTIMVGRLGDDSLAGIAIGATMFHFVSLIIAGVIYSVSPIVSQAVGAKETSKIGRAVRQGFWIAVIGCVPCLIIYWNAEPLLRLLGQEEKVIALSSGYLRAISFGMLPALLTYVLRGFLEGISDTKPILVISLIAVGLNIFLNDAFMFGKYGFPELGLVGTGVASSIMYLIIFLMMAGYVWFKHSGYKIFTQIHAPDLTMIGELLRVGIPISMTIFFEFSMFAACSLAMGVIGSKQLAAHQIALQTASITFMIPLGIALATSVRVGNFAGQANWARAKVAGQVGMMTAVGVMTITAIVFWTFPRTIVSFYLDVDLPENQQAVEFAISFLFVAALFQVVDGLQVAASNSLRGLKQTKAAMFWTMMAYWGIGLPACAILGFKLTRFGGWGLGLGGVGLWYGLTVGLAAAAIFLAVRFHWEFRQQTAIDPDNTSDAN
jgi:MATE family multidrug resistance protein